MSINHALVAANDGAEQQSLSETAYQRLRARILEGALQQGSLLIERRIADAIGVSRTPLRAALVRLEGEGLVERLASGAALIRRFSVEDFLQILTVRRALESEGAALATGRMGATAIEKLTTDATAFAEGRNVDFEQFWRHDDEFHVSIAEASGEQLLSKMVADLRRKARMCHLLRMPANFVDQGSEHLLILKALSGDDPEMTRRKMRGHVQAVRDRLTSWLTHGAPQAGS